MYKFNEDRKNFSLILKSSCILVLIIAIFLFKYFPANPKQKREKFQYQEPIITLVDIPIYISKSKQNNKKRAPLLPQIIIDNYDEPEFLNDMIIADLTIDEKEISEDSNNSNKSIPFQPKLLLEVIPDLEGCSGRILLKIKIGVNGKVTDYEILKNTFETKQCLQNVLNAINYSKWKPVTFEGEKIAVWIEKEYSMGD